MAQQPLLSLLLRAVRNLESRDGQKALIARAAEHCLGRLLAQALSSCIHQALTGGRQQLCLAECLARLAEHVEFGIRERQNAVDFFFFQYLCKLL